VATTPPDPSPAQPGLRERKKAGTRRAISDVATRLFMERGFDAVTVAEVADAADVSVKTVFNYFGSKEDLFLDREAEIRAEVVDAITDRPAGTSVVTAFRVLLADHRVPGERGWAALRDPERSAALRRFLETWRDSATLRGRHLLGNERLQAALAATLARDLGLRAPDDRVRVMAAMLVATMQLRQTTLAEAVLAGASARTAERRVRAVVAEALDRVAAAFPELDEGTARRG
jgi:AcrR family transcriptional regulator